MKLLSRRLIFIGLIVLGFATILATTAASLPDQTRNILGSGQAYDPLDAPPPNWELANAYVDETAEIVSAENLANLPPPEQNPCQHCHIEGEIYWEWSPISRWFVFGAMNLIFIFGITRNVMVWKSREIWHHRWMFQLGNIAAFLFILQASTGIVLMIANRATLENVTIGQLVSLINAVHWGSALILFIATLALSLGGYLLPWYQRAFWGLIFIGEIIGGTLAIANLSFAYLYAEWHIPPLPSHFFAFHMLLTPIAIASLMSIYFIMLRKRGETR